ncbi:unnamed protein product, partial [Didymodactylos carnosus]
LNHVVDFNESKSLIPSVGQLSDGHYNDIIKWSDEFFYTNTNYLPNTVYNWSSSTQYVGYILTNLPASFSFNNGKAYDISSFQATSVLDNYLQLTIIGSYNVNNEIRIRTKFVTLSAYTKTLIVLNWSKILSMTFYAYSNSSCCIFPTKEPLLTNARVVFNYLLITSTILEPDICLNDTYEMCSALIGNCSKIEDTLNYNDVLLAIESSCFKTFACELEIIFNKRLSQRSFLLLTDSLIRALTKFQ